MIKLNNILIANYRPVSPSTCFLQPDAEIDKGHGENSSRSNAARYALPYVIVVSSGVGNEIHWAST